MPRKKHSAEEIISKLREAEVSTWALGVYHGLRRTHFQTYLDEFVFRFNRRGNRHAGFARLFNISLGHKPITYNMLIKPDAQHKPLK